MDCRKFTQREQLIWDEGYRCGLQQARRIIEDEISDQVNRQIQKIAEFEAKVDK